jgi:hypothetical protein
LYRCYITAAVTEQEGLYSFAIGGAGEIGQYQFKVETLRIATKLAGEDYKNLTHKDLVNRVLDSFSATYYFTIYFDYLLKACRGNTWCALEIYNSGLDKKAYAASVYKRYMSFVNGKSFDCF